MRTRLVPVLAGLALTLIGAAAQAQDATLAALHVRGRQLLQVYQPALFRNPDVKVRSYDTIAYTALRGLRAVADVGRHGGRAATGPDRQERRQGRLRLRPATDHPLHPPVRALLSPAQLDRARSLLSLPQQLFSHGTLNHALMSSTSYYLLAEHFPDQRWADPKGRPYTSAEVVSRYKDLLLQRFRGFMADGFNEQLSPTYAIANLYPLLNLIDFAQDPDIRAAAEQMAVAQIGLLRADSIDGAVMPPLERREHARPDQQQPADQRSRSSLVLLWRFQSD